MNARLESQLARYAAILCLCFACSGVAHAQRYGTGATLGYYLSAYRLNIPAIRVGDKYYAVRMAGQLVANQPGQVGSQAPSWTVEEALRIPPVGADYLSGSYHADVLDLPCVDFAGDLYAAQLVATNPGAHSFTLKSYRRIEACPKPPDIGPVRGQWVRTAASPLSARADVALAWTGKEIIVLGGTDEFRGPAVDGPVPEVPPFSDGAAYNPLTDTWRKIADAPAPLAVHAIASIGTSVFVHATSNAREPAHLYRYRSTQDAWDEFILPTGVQRPGIAAFGNNLLLYSRNDESEAPSDRLLDPATGEWTLLPPDPLEPSYSRTYVVHGADLYLFTRYLIDLPGPYDDRFVVRAARWREGQWTALPTPESQPEVGIRTPTLIAGQRLIAPSLDCDTGDYTPHDRCIPYGTVFDTTTDTWQELPNAPGGGLRFFASGGGLSTSHLLLGQPGHPALDATTNEWFLVPRLDAYDNFVMTPSIAGMGPYGFAYGGGNSLGLLVRDSWIWKP